MNKGCGTSIYATGFDHGVLKQVGTEFVHDRLVLGNSAQNDENFVKEPRDA
jgi:hypothetical protein